MPRDVWGTYVTPDEWEAAARIGISQNTLLHRLRSGWKAKRAISEPLNHKNSRCPGYQKFKQIALGNDISVPTFNYRVNHGWSLEESATTPVLSRQEISQRGYAARKRKLPAELVKTALENGISRKTLWTRINYLFWDPVDASTVPVGSRQPGRDYFRKLNNLTFTPPPR